MKLTILLAACTSLVSCAHQKPEFVEAIHSIQPGMTRADLNAIMPKNETVTTVYVTEAKLSGFRYIEDHLIDLQYRFQVTYHLYDPELRAQYVNTVKTFRNSRPHGDFISPESQNNPKDIILDVSRVMKQDYAEVPWLE